MDHTNEIERWRLEMEVDRLQAELDEMRLVLARVDELYQLLQYAITYNGQLFVGSLRDQERIRNVGKAIARLQETYATWHRNTYPDDRP